MGGKNKQAQRIKNNARPSSSGRSAELLASSSHISTLKEIRFVPPTLSLMKTEEFDASVSPAFQIVFKKMNKKDCTTKIKALQEFSDLVSSSEPEAVKAILGFWTTLYSILTVDTDHRVREAVHNAHYQIVLKDKKMIAPFLKQLIGPWFTSQYDNYPPAATAASKAFTAAFPPNKVQDCVIFCQKEIVTYILENLTSKLEVGKTATNDDQDAKFERIIIATLQGYCLYLETLTSEHIEKTSELNQMILSNQKFLKLATHSSGIIRATFFKVLATLYHKAPFLLTNQNAQLIPIIFNNLDENDPSVVSFVWDAILLIMASNEDWWKSINVEKNFVSKLKKMLREGGHGNAHVIYPNLLSILNKLPPSLNVDQFFDSIFENLRQGLKKKSVLASKSESGAVVTAIVECLQYVIIQNQANCDLCQKLIKAHLISLIEWSLTNEQICYRTVFHQLALLVQYWSRNKNFDVYLTYFWSQMQEFFTSFVCTDETRHLVDRQVTLLQLLKQKAKVKQMKVTFGDKENVIKEVNNENDIDKVYNENLQSLAYVILTSYVRQIDSTKATFLLANIHSIIVLFESHSFLIGLSKIINRENQGLLDLYQNILLKWLQIPELSTEIVINLAFVLVKYVTVEEKDTILESFFTCDCELFKFCVINAFSHPHNTDGAVQAWLKTSKVGDFLLTVTDANLELDCSPELKNLFKLMFTENENGDLLIDGTALEKIVKKLEIPLLSPQEFAISIDSCAHVASYLTDCLYVENFSLKFGDSLLLAVFKFSCRDNSDLEFLTDDTLFEIDTSWQGVVSTLSKILANDEILTLTRKFANVIETEFRKINAERIIDSIVNFLSSVFVGKPLVLTEVSNIFFDRPFVSEFRRKIENLCTIDEYLCGKLASCQKIDNYDICEDVDILTFVQWNLVKISVLLSTLGVNNDEESENKVILTVDDNATVISNLIFDTTLCHTFLQHHAMSKFFVTIQEIFEKTKNKLCELIDFVKIDNLIYNVLQSKASCQSFMVAKAIYVLHKVLRNEPIETLPEIKSAIKNDLSKLHLTQLYGKNLSFDDVDHTSSSFDSFVTLRTLTHCDGIDVQIAEVFEKIKKERTKDIPKFLFDNKDLSWAEMEIVIEVIRVFSALIRDKFDSLNRQHWDFGVICLSSWTTNCLKMRQHVDRPQIRAFMIAVGDFYISLSDKMAVLRAENLKNSFLDEWNDLILPYVHNDFLQLWLYLAEHFSNKPIVQLDDHVFLQEFGRITDHFVYKFIFNKESGLPSWGKILKRCCMLLVNSSAILQIWGYKMASILIGGLIEIDMQFDSCGTPNTKGFTVQQFRNVLEDTHNIVEGVLSAFKLGEDTCQITPFTDSYTYVFAYLLLWGIFLNMCEKSPPELRYQYADWFRNDTYIKSLLNNLFKLMPTEILHLSESKAKTYSKLFTTEPSLTFKEPCTSEKLEQRVCWIYYSCLSQLPALVRLWWSETETRVTQIVERITALYVSPQLCHQELQDVGHRENNFKNMTVKIIPSVREVVAVYTVDEAQMELVITLPQNYPLGGPDVRCNRQIGGPLHKQWLMQLKKYLLHQNGTIWDGLALWNSSLDKKFDGVEECYICFAVLHPGTYQLPKLSCQTCKKKFHSACLYKWFSTSNKSSCPICRNLF